MALKRVEYVGPADEVEFEVGPDQWVTCKRGANVEVPAGLADGLCEQQDNWRPVESKKTATPKNEGTG